MKLESLEIQVNYTSKEIDKLEKIAIGDWIDLHSADTVEIKAGESVIISLGVRIKLPEGYEAHIVPRSGTFKKYGVIMTNSPGIIDCSYLGEWHMQVYATRDTKINVNDRLCQFRVVENQPRLVFTELSDEEFGSFTTQRGTKGFGSTGI